MNKKELREKYKKIRNLETDTKKPFATLEQWQIFKDANVVMGYQSINNEPYVPCEISGKTVVLPVTDVKNGVITPYTFTHLKKGAYNIMEPQGGEQYRGKIDLIIVPGICFNKKGYRVGYGKGYYDRFLKGKDGITVGLCYESLLTEEEFQCEFDIKVNYIATEKALYKVEI